MLDLCLSFDVFRIIIIISFLAKSSGHVTKGTVEKSSTTKIHPQSTNVLLLPIKFSTHTHTHTHTHIYIYIYI